jgi:hypothetical protein
VDYQALLYGPTHSLLGVPASVRLGNTDYSLTALDKTAGMVVGSGLEIQSVLPAAVVLVSELASQGLTPEQLDGQQLTMNGKVWVISSTRARPSPNGEADGELLLILEGGW